MIHQMDWKIFKIFISCDEQQYNKFEKTLSFKLEEWEVCGVLS